MAKKQPIVCTGRLQGYGTHPGATPPARMGCGYLLGWLRQVGYSFFQCNM